MTAQSSHARKTARTDVDEWQIYQAMNILPSKTKYKTLHEALRQVNAHEAIFINDFAPTDWRRRCEYISNLVFPINYQVHIRYTYTTLQSHLHFVWKLDVADKEGVRQQKNETKEKLRSQGYHGRRLSKVRAASYEYIVNFK